MKPLESGITGSSWGFGVNTGWQKKVPVSLPWATRHQSQDLRQPGPIIWDSTAKTVQGIQGGAGLYLLRRMREAESFEGRRRVKLPGFSFPIGEPAGESDSDFIDTILLAEAQCHQLLPYLEPVEEALQRLSAWEERGLRRRMHAAYTFLRDAARRKHEGSTAAVAPPVS